MKIGCLNWKIIVTIGTGLLVGCGEGQKQQTGLTVKDATHHKLSGVRHLSSCPSAAPSGVDSIEYVKPKDAVLGNDNLTRKFQSTKIGATLVSVAVDTLTNAISASLAEAEGNLNGQFIASGVSRGGPELVSGKGIRTHDSTSCFVIVRGVSGALGNDVSLDGLPKNTLKALGLSDQPAFYAEFEDTIQGNQRVVTLRHIHYAQTSAKWNGNGEKAVTIGLNLAVSKVDGDDEIRANEIYLFDVGRLEIGTKYNLAFPISQSSAKTAEGVYNIVAVISESEKPSVALKSLAKAFEANKEDLESALKPEDDE